MTGIVNNFVMLFFGVGGRKKFFDVGGVGLSQYESMRLCPPLECKVDAGWTPSMTRRCCESAKLRNTSVFFCPSRKKEDNAGLAGSLDLSEATVGCQI